MFTQKERGAYTCLHGWNETGTNMYMFTWKETDRNIQKEKDEWEMCACDHKMR